MPEFKLQILAPTRILYDDLAESIRAPGVMGAFEVLAGHIPLLAALDIGEIVLRRRGGERIHLAASGGFLEVLRVGVTVLLEAAERPEEIDVKRAQGAFERARAHLRKRSPGTDISRAEAALERARTRLKVASRANGIDAPETVSKMNSEHT